VSTASPVGAAPTPRTRLSDLLSGAADTGYRAFAVRAALVLTCALTADLLAAAAVRWLALPGGLDKLGFLAVCGGFGAAVTAVFQKGAEASTRLLTGSFNAAFYALTAVVLLALCPGEEDLAVGVAVHAAALAVLLPLAFNVSRPLTTRAFATFAFAATYFGLAMLVVFFTSIAVKVSDWFRAMPALVEKENRKLREKAENQYSAAVWDKTAEMLRDFAPEVKQFGPPRRWYRQRSTWPADTLKEWDETRAGQFKDLEIKGQEWRLEAEKLVRPEPTPAHLVKHFLTERPGDKPAQAGIMPALVGSLYIGLLTVLFALPLGVGAAVFLEEYQQNNRLARFIQVNINNLAGVPSIIYGILGAAVFVDALFKRLHSEYYWIADRNLLAGGLTLALLTLPVVIVSAQEAIRAVPSSLRHAALALGATRWQTIWRVVLPASLPGVLTGIILAVSRALGEAAPLVMFGAILYTSDPPGLFSRFSVLPMQIYYWTGLAEPGWLDNAAMASAVLVGLVLVLNGFAIWYRHRMAQKVRW
jgi:phosphate transport system permease protein